MQPDVTRLDSQIVDLEERSQKRRERAKKLHAKIESWGEVLGIPFLLVMILARVTIPTDFLADWYLGQMLLIAAMAGAIISTILALGLSLITFVMRSWCFFADRHVTKLQKVRSDVLFSE